MMSNARVAVMSQSSSITSFARLARLARLAQLALSSVGARPAAPVPRLALAALAAACLFWGGAGRAEAQERSTPQPPVIELEEDFVIEGHVRKPEAFYFLRRTPFGFVIRTLDEDFLHEVVRSVGAEPF